MAPNRRRKELIWQSNNQYLIGNVKKMKPSRRHPNFSCEETRMLISLWGDPKVQRSLITIHKKSPIIEKLAQSMHEKGFYRTATEINVRIKNLKCFYSRQRKEIEKGILKEPTWIHYSAMDKIVRRPVFGRLAREERIVLLNQDRLAKQKNLKLDNKQKQQVRSSLVEQQKFENDFNRTNIKVILSDKKGNAEVELNKYDSDVDIDGFTIDEDFLCAESSGKSKILGKVKILSKTITSPVLAPKTSILAINVPTDSAKISPVLPLSDIKVEEPEPDIKSKESKGAQLGSHHGFSISLVEGADSNSSATTSKITTPSTSTQQPRNNNFQEAYKQQFRITSSANTTPRGKISVVPSSSLLKKSQASITTTANNTAHTGRISIVPTNTLLKPQLQQKTNKPIHKGPTQLTFQSPQMLYANSENNAAKASNRLHPVTFQQTHGVNGIQMNPNSGMPMQVLLVNHMPQNQQKSSTNVTQTRREKINENVSTHTNQHNVSDETETEIKRPAKKKCSPGFRSLFTQLVRVEKQNLEMNRRRLKVEHDRLRYERSIGDKILSALEFFQTKVMQPETSGEKSNLAVATLSRNSSTKSINGETLPS